MARVIDADAFSPFKNGFGFDQLFNGQTWELRARADFNDAPSTLRGKIREEFERRYGELRVDVDGDVIRVQHVPGRTPVSLRATGQSDE